MVAKRQHSPHSYFVKQINRKYICILCPIVFLHQDAWLNYVRTILFSERISADAVCHFLMWSGVFVKGGGLRWAQKHNFRTLLRF